MHLSFTPNAPAMPEISFDDFLAVDIRDLPNDKASGWRASGKPLLSWTIRSQQLRDRALAHVDAMISEGEGLA